RIVVVDVSGEDLRKIIARQAHNHRRRAGFSGMRVFVDCDGDQMSIRMTLDDDRDIQDSDRIRIVANDFLTTGGDDILTPAMPADGFTYEDDPRLTRDVVADWLRNRGGHLSADQFQDPKNRRWNLPDLLPATCSL
ncbi:MAG: 5'-nucleotidase C-terminal domain-containing protein, partial [Proteobacteria bacterium]|nr:5'-nucleotidase C-terminal domain-containing protein [Pseudomonadota bacterium]